MSRPPSIFMSHNFSDKPFVRNLAEKLGYFGVKAWVDEFEILPGDSLLRKIADGLGDSDYVAAVLSPRSVASEWVSRELDVAVNEEIEGRRVRVLPLLIEDCAIPTFLKGKLYVDFRKDFSAGLMLLLRRLLSDKQLEGLTDETMRRWINSSQPTVRPPGDFARFVLQLEEQRLREQAAIAAERVRINEACDEFKNLTLDETIERLRASEFAKIYSLACGWSGSATCGCGAPLVMAQYFDDYVCAKFGVGRKDDSGVYDALKQSVPSKNLVTFHDNQELCEDCWTPVNWNDNPNS